MLRRLLVFVFAECITIFACGGMCILMRHMLLPNVTWEEKLSLTFNTMCSFPNGPVNNMCDFPNAELLLLSSLQGIPALTQGQPYTITSDLYVPDSPRNHAAGVSIITLDLLDKNRTLVKQFRKSFAVPYRSTLVRLVNRILLLPFYLTRVFEEELHIPIVLVSDYVDYGPTWYGRLTLESRDLVWSRSSVRFHAALSGLRSWLYYWPWLSFFTIFSSFVVGIHITFAFLLLSGRIHLKAD